VTGHAMCLASQHFGFTKLSGVDIPGGCLLLTAVLQGKLHYQVHLLLLYLLARSAHAWWHCGV